MAAEQNHNAERRAMFAAFSECLVHGNSMTPTEIADKLLSAHRPSASIGEDGLPELATSIDTTEFLDLVCEWRDGITDGACWSDIIKHIHDFARAAIAADRRRQSDMGILASAPQAAQGVKPPITAEEVVAFIGNHYNKMYDAHDVEGIVFELTVHDLQSALRWWFEDDAAPPLSSEQQEEKGESNDRT